MNVKNDEKNGQHTRCLENMLLLSNGARLIVIIAMVNIPTEI
jgi:hypothetical protein